MQHHEHEHEHPPHGSPGHHRSLPDERDPEEFWDELYRARDRVWSGRPNAALVALADGLEPGRVLDLGCGEGADAIWLASAGWRVTAVDISPLAIERATAAAVEAGVADHIEWQHHDLAASMPPGPFELVSAQFLQSPLDFPRGAVLGRAAGAVAVGGRIAVVGHAAPPRWAHDVDPSLHFPSARETAEAAGLTDSAWHLEVCEERERDVTGPDGEPATLLDSVVLARRISPRS